jgi:predicted RNase H-like HicB family nuclease
MYRFLVVIEKASGNYSAYSPDLPGCVATGATREETERNIYEAIQMHVQGLLEDSTPVPETQSFAEYMAIPVGQKSIPHYATRTT